MVRQQRSIPVIFFNVFKAIFPIPQRPTGEAVHSVSRAGLQMDDDCPAVKSSSEFLFIPKSENRQGTFSFFRSKHIMRRKNWNQDKQKKCPGSKVSSFEMHHANSVFVSRSMVYIKQNHKSLCPVQSRMEAIVCYLSILR